MFFRGEENVLVCSSGGEDLLFGSEMFPIDSESKLMSTGVERERRSTCFFLVFLISYFTVCAVRTPHWHLLHAFFCS